MLPSNGLVSAGRVQYPKISVFVDVADKKECYSDQLENAKEKQGSWILDDVKIKTKNKIKQKNSWFHRSFFFKK